jgi:hypothetical protein
MSESCGCNKKNKFVENYVTMNTMNTMNTMKPKPYLKDEDKKDKKDKKEQVQEQDQVQVQVQVQEQDKDKDKDKDSRKEKVYGNVEHFSFEAPKNMCHYACSTINVTNILLCVLILILLYLISREKFNFSIFKKN